MRKMFPLLLLLLQVFSVSADSHSLRYYKTVVSGTGLGLPEFSEVGYVDDQQIVHYTSDSRVYRPVAAWMEKLGADYWEGQTQIGRNNEAVFKHNVRTVMSRFNQTTGLHSVQLMQGCELRDDGSTAGYKQYGYDGRDFTYLDTQSWRFIPIMDAAQISAQRFNSPDVQEGERQKNYLQNICIEWLKTYINHGRDALEKRVSPEVKVSGHQSDGVTRLRCWVYGYHPRAVDVRWMRDGVDEVPIDEATQILPNPDGTYQTRVSVEVAAGEEQRYSCHVDHSSLGETLVVTWEPKSGFPTGVILGVLGGLVLLAAAIAGVCIYRKRNPGYKTTGTSDAASDSSGNAEKA